ncbi:hypothetical protein GCM10010435_60270 [Winogradskya consettensis]|uniref:Anti-sigma K factor RskA C-terminal domain-containing protein n=1 Tax=Winogradskya consettensis TaxID=113560 RepID=A0A919SS12_9ACTN|nr:anti-sigma factor [Actinoplanes consettensis]GIM76412.1 hypothetical protein Aco04nite_50290 [Actinoplanes consettensis]
MEHLDPDRLVLLALSEDSTEPDESMHLAVCPGCRSDFESLHHVATLAAEGPSLGEQSAAPDRIWQAIESEIAQLNRPVRVPDQPGDNRAFPPATRRRPRRLLAPVLAAAAAAVLAVAGTLAVTRTADRQPPDHVAAHATLSPLPEVPPAAHGSATVLTDGTIEIDTRDLPLTTGFHEVWLIDPADTTRMVALGNLSQDQDALLPVPPGVDLNRYRLVDVSDEPHDGDAAHSGHSLLRGTLTS